MSFPSAAPGISLGAAFATVHRDPRWWAKCLLYGAFALTGIGLPLAAGFIIESYDNSRKGFATPLPPWSDPATRWLAGLFALLVDFSFFLLPLIVAVLLLLCVSVGLLIAGMSNPDTMTTAAWLIGGGALAFMLAMFALSVSPAGRLRFVRDGRPEEAIGADTLQWVMDGRTRGSFARARLASLPAYLPALVVGAGIFAVSRVFFPGQLIAMLALGWLALSAIIYAHLIVAQLYIAAEREIQRRNLGM